MSNIDTKGNADLFNIFNFEVDSVDEKYFIVNFFMCECSGVNITKIDNRNNIIFMNVPSEYDIQNKKFMCLSGDNLANLFKNFIKHLNLVNGDEDKGIHKEFKVFYKIRDEIWNYDKYTERKKQLMEDERYKDSTEEIKEALKRVEGEN